jgi:hypothetical protein
MIGTFFGLARLGHAGGEGMPYPLQLAQCAREFRDVTVFRSPPRGDPYERDKDSALRRQLARLSRDVPAALAQRAGARTQHRLPKPQWIIPSCRGHKPISPRRVKSYLQLITTAKNRSAAIIDELRDDGFPVVASDVPGKSGLHRMLSGPLSEDEVDKTPADLQTKGFPGDSAMERTF